MRGGYYRSIQLESLELESVIIIACSVIKLSLDSVLLFLSVEGDL